MSPDLASWYKALAFSQSISTGISIAPHYAIPRTHHMLQDIDLLGQDLLSEH
jgi:hypothetical protein